jgi:Tol biopolymer transport system component
LQWVGQSGAFSPDEHGGGFTVKKWIIIVVSIAVVVTALVVGVAYVVLRQTWSKPDVVERMEPVPNATSAWPVAWSPDGQRLVYEWSGVRTINIDGTDETYLGQGRSPMWSPDGSRIAFATDNGLEVVT